MNNEPINDIDILDIDYTIVNKRINDILVEVTDDLDERILIESIITGIEKSASETIKAGKVAQLPFIGCIRKSPVKKAMQDNYENFRIARKNMTKEQYKAHVSSFIVDAKKSIERENFRKHNVKKVRSRNRKRYDVLFINLGKPYAEMFIFAILSLKEVPYNQDVQDAFDRLKD